MRTIISLIALLLTLTTTAQEPDYVRGHLMVSFKNNVKHTNLTGDLTRFEIPQLDEIGSKYGCYRIHTLKKAKEGYGGVYLLYFPDSTSIPVLMGEYERTGLFKAVEADHIAVTNGVPQPNDTLFHRQWALYNDGSFPIGAVKAGADIDILDAWGVEDGDTSVLVAVLDSGVKPDHADLQGRLWKNLQEIPGNGVDDDGNGYIDDTLGWNFAYQDNDIADDNGHGTNVTGIIGANVNNVTGYAGVDQHCKLMICKAANDMGMFDYSWMIEAIYYAADNGANIMNISAGGGISSSIMKDAIDEAYAKNVVICAAMGNTGTSVPIYPAAYPNVIAVGATGPNDTTTSFSTFGNHISVVAPGSYIYGLWYQSDTATGMAYSGTSQATPHVTGIAALLLAQDKTRTPAQVRALIENNAEDMVGSSRDVPGWDKYYGHGRVNAYRSLANAALTVSTIKQARQMNVFPNPASGTVYISTDRTATGTITIANTTGNIVYTAAARNGLHAVNLQGFAAGAYIVTLQRNGSEERAKLVIQ